MNGIKNNKLNILGISLLLASIDLNIVGQQSEQKQSEQSSLVVTEPVLSEQQIAAYLQSKFATLQVAPDVDVRYVARMLGQKTQKELDVMLDSIAKLVEQDSAKIVTMQHIRSVKRPRNDAVTAYLLYLVLFNKKSIAIHEAGHAVAIAHLLSDYQIIDEVSITGNQAQGYLGINTLIDRYNNFNHLSDENWILFEVRAISNCFSGHIAQEIFQTFQLNSFWIGMDYAFDYAKWFTPSKTNIGKNDFEDFLLKYGTASDTKIIYEICDRLRPNWNEVEKKEWLRGIYEEAYDFILDHKDEVEKIANILEQEHHIIGQRLYHLLGLPMPKLDFQEEVVISTETENLTQPAKNSIKKQVVASKSKAALYKKRKK